MLLTCKSEDPLASFASHPNVSPASCVHSFIPGVFTNADNSIDYFQLHKSFSIGLRFISCQSLFFDSPAQLFKSDYLFDLFIAQLNHICKLCQLLEAKYLVFGSPNNRIGYEEVSSPVAFERMKTINGLMQTFDLFFCIEHVLPPACRSDEVFCTTLDSCFDFVRSLNLSRICVNPDLGMFTCEHGSSILTHQIARAFVDTVNNSCDIVKHIHISLPGLRPFSANEEQIVENIIYPSFSQMKYPLVYEVLQC
jgi:hypothetical protein